MFASSFYFYLTLHFTQTTLCSICYNTAPICQSFIYPSHLFLIYFSCTYERSLPHSPDSFIIVIGLFCSSPSPAQTAVAIQQSLRCCSSSKSMNVCRQSQIIRVTPASCVWSNPSLDPLIWNNSFQKRHLLCSFQFPPPLKLTTVEKMCGQVTKNIQFGSVRGKFSTYLRLQREVLLCSTEHLHFQYLC